MFSENGRFPSSTRIKLLQHKCAALPRRMLMFDVFRKPTKQKENTHHRFIALVTAPSALGQQQQRKKRARVPVVFVGQHVHRRKKESRRR